MFMYLPFLLSLIGLQTKVFSMSLVLCLVFFAVGISFMLRSQKLNLQLKNASYQLHIQFFADGFYLFDRQLLLYIQLRLSRLLYWPYWYLSSYISNHCIYFIYLNLFVHVLLLLLSYCISGHRSFSFIKSFLRSSIRDISTQDLSVTTLFHLPSSIHFICIQFVCLVTFLLRIIQYL